MPSSSAASKPKKGKSHKAQARFYWYCVGSPLTPVILLIDLLPLLNNEQCNCARGPESIHLTSCEACEHARCINCDVEKLRK